MSDTPSLETIRSAISDADQIILRALAARFRAVEHLKEFKKVHHLPVEDLQRETLLKNQWKQAATVLNIPEELALLILDFILAESKRVQNS